MRTKRITSFAACRGRLPAVVAGLAAVFALVLPGSAVAGSGAEAAEFSAAELAAVSAAVESADVGGTAWAVDEVSGVVSLLADSTVSSGELAAIRKAAGPRAGAVEVERIPGELTPLIHGGEPIYTGGGRCSLGFNVQGGAYALTAGHCTNIGSSWSNSAGTVFGSTAYSSFPGDDYGFLQHNGAETAPSQVICDGEVIPITGVADAYIGMAVTRSGSTTGCHSGTVTGLNYTVNYGSGQVVYGLVRTDICAEPGDSGGPLISGNDAVATLSGGSGNCTSGGTTYYQPVREALDRYGITLP